MTALSLAVGAWRTPDMIHLFTEKTYIVALLASVALWLIAFPPRTNEADDLKEEANAYTVSTPSAQTITTRLRFPKDGLTPYNVTINSIMDHARSTGGVLVAYTGERGRNVDGPPCTSPSGKSLLYGYVKTGGQCGRKGSEFTINGKYSGAGVPTGLWYENSRGYKHSGYDYSINGEVIAPAAGKLYIVKYDSYDGPTSGSSSAWARFHTFKIVHPDGLETWFLHTTRFVRPSDPGVSRDLDSEVRTKLGGDAGYNGTQPFDANVLVGDVSAGEPIAIVGGCCLGFPIHLHFEARFNDVLVDPYGWEGNSNDPLSGSPGEILWEGYNKPTITNALLNTNTNTLTVTGNNLGANSTLDIWKRLDVSTDAANKNDGTKVKNLVVQSSSNNQIVASVDQDVVNNYGAYVVKVVTSTGPRSEGVAISTGSGPPPNSDFSLSLIPFLEIAVPGDTVGFSVLTSTIAGSPQTLNLSLTNLPSGVTGSFSPPTITSGQVSTLILTVASGATSGDFQFTVTGKSGSTSHSDTAQLTLSGRPTASFTMNGCGRFAANNQTLPCSVAPGSTASVDFDSSSSQSGGGTIDARQWKVDGTTVSTSNQFRYGLGAGTHTITLDIRNSAGIHDSTSGTVVVTQTSALAPSINSINPTSVAPSTFDLTINGTNFDSGAIDQVFLGNTFIGNGTILSRTSTQIVVREFMTGASPATYTVKVRNSDGQLSNGAALTLASTALSPVINSISPLSTTPSTFDLTINGSNFDSGTIDQIFFGSTFIGNGTILSRTSTQIVVREFMTGASSGTYTVKVKNSKDVLSNGLSLVLNPLPSITSISPTSVLPSTFELTINGNNFDSGAVDQIFLGSAFIGNGTILSRTSAQIRVREFMTGASPGTYTVKVRNSNGGLSNGVPLVLTAPPSITSINPTSVAPSTFDLTINGSNFDSGAIDQIFIGATLIGNGTILSRSGTQIVVREFMTGASAGNYTVKVKNSDGQLSNGATLTLAAGPTITSISPTSVAPSTFDLTINGNNFDSGAIDQIFLGTSLIGNGSILSRSSTQIEVREFMTGASPGTYTVKVKNSNGLLSNGVSLVLNAPPSISSINPTSISPSTFDLTINGSNFDVGAIDQVFLGSTLIGNGTILSRSGTQIIVREFMSGASAGTYTVKVKNSDGQLSNGASLTLTAVPSITSISPTSVAPSTFDLTINGSNFDGAAIDQIFLGSTFIGNGSILSRSSTQITVREFMTGASPGTYTVKVKNSNGALSNGLPLVLNAPPSVSSINPSTVTASTFDLTINGSNFSSGAIDQIFFGSTFIGNGTILSRSSTQIRVREFMTGATLGNYTVKVKNSDGQLSNGVTLTLASMTPSITSISPNSVSPSTFDLTINGSNFDGGAIDQIFFGTTLIGNGSILSRTNTQIVVREFMTGATRGTYTVKVKNATGQLSNGVSLTLN